MIAVKRARLPRPAVRHAQIALGRAAALFVGQHAALCIDELRAHAEEGAPGAPRLHRVRAWQGGYHDATGLGLPPGIDDGDAFFADDLVIPAPRLWIDRSEEHTSELQSLIRITYAVFCLKKK